MTKEKFILQKELIQKNMNNIKINKMKILAIDPGFERVGIAVIKKTTTKKDILIYSTCFKTSAKISFPGRLRNIGLEVEKVIKKYKAIALYMAPVSMNT